MKFKINAKITRNKFAWESNVQELTNKAGEDQKCSCTRCCHCECGLDRIL